MQQGLSLIGTLESLRDLGLLTSPAKILLARLCLQWTVRSVIIFYIIHVVFLMDKCNRAIRFLTLF